MAEGERFDLAKFFSLNGIGFAKVLGLAWKAALLALIILGLLWVKNLLFPTPASNITNPEFHVAQGGTLQYEIHQGPEPRAWWVPTPFVEVFGEMKTEDDPQFGARVGARWEF